VTTYAVLHEHTRSLDEIPIDWNALVVIVSFVEMLFAFRNLYFLQLKAFFEFLLALDLFTL